MSYPLGTEPRCSTCGTVLAPAGARIEGSDGYVGYHPCARHPRALPVYPGHPAYGALREQRLNALHASFLSEGIAR